MLGSRGMEGIDRMKPPQPRADELRDDPIFPGDTDPDDINDIKADSMERLDGAAPNDKGGAGPVIGVIKIRIEATDAPGLLAESLEVLAAEAQALQGFVAAQILVSVDKKTMVVLTEWADHHAWSQSRYDARVGAMIERLYLKSATIEFETYTRRGNFARASLMAK